MIFISSDKILDRLIKNLNLGLNNEQHDNLVYELYKHIESTRRVSYGNGYDQGKFDKEMDIVYEQEKGNDLTWGVKGK